MDNAESINKAVTVLSFAGLFYPPTTLSSAYLLNVSDGVGIGIDSVQAYINPNEDTLFDLGVNAVTTAFTSYLGRAANAVLGLSYDTLTSSGRAYQVVEKTKMYKFVSDSMIFKNKQISGVISVVGGAVVPYAADMMRCH